MVFSASYSEKGAWATLVVTSVAYAYYVSMILDARSATGSLVEVAYMWPLFTSWGLAVAGQVASQIAIAISSPKDAGKSDERDAEIHRFGEMAGDFILIVASVNALLMAVFQAEYFWIANTINLGLFLGTAVSSILKIYAYRRGVPQW